MKETNTDCMQYIHSYSTQLTLQIRQVKKNGKVLFQNTFNKPSNRDINETCKIKRNEVALQCQ